MLVDSFTVQSPNVCYTDEHITSTYDYASTKLTRTEKGSWVVSPTSTQYQFRVDRRVPKLGYVADAAVMLRERSQGAWRAGTTALPADTQPLSLTSAASCRVMLVGLGGNNGTTVLAGILANKQ